MQRAPPGLGVRLRPQGALGRDLAVTERLAKICAIGGIQQSTDLAQFACGEQAADRLLKDINNAGLTVPPRTSRRVGAAGPQRHAVVGGIGQRDHGRGGQRPLHQLRVGLLRG